MIGSEERPNYVLDVRRSAEKKEKKGKNHTVGINPGGGQTKLPPTRIQMSDWRILSIGCQSQLATIFSGDFWIASSRYGGAPLEVVRPALEGGEVIVKPPGLGIPGTKTSSHCPGRNWTRRKELLVYSGLWYYVLAGFQLVMVSRV